MHYGKDVPETLAAAAHAQNLSGHAAAGQGEFLRWEKVLRST